jgi:hypothetical protein
MHFYHGTNAVIGDIDFNKCRLRTDFSRGFYISNKLGSAKDWAIGKAGFSGMPTVMRYEISRDIFNDTSLSILRFDNPSAQWLDFIRDNRRRDIENNGAFEPRHNHDIVSGPIANDKVADVVDLYCKGRINAEEAITRAKALPIVFQLSLHTAQTLKFIDTVMYSQRKGRKWGEWQSI